jgi:hypothetical protein
MATKIRLSNITQALDGAFSANGTIKSVSGTFVAGETTDPYYSQYTNNQLQFHREGGYSYIDQTANNATTTGLKFRVGPASTEALIIDKDANVTISNNLITSTITTASGDLTISPNGSDVVVETRLTVSGSQPGIRFSETDTANSEFMIRHNGGNLIFESRDETFNTIFSEAFRIAVDGTVTTGGDLNVGGDLIISGNTTYINTDNLEIEDLNITLASGAANSAVANNSGITVDGANATITYRSQSDVWNFNKDIRINDDAANSAATDGMGIFWDLGGTDQYLVYRDNAGSSGFQGLYTNRKLHLQDTLSLLGNENYIEFRTEGNTGNGKYGLKFIDRHNASSQGPEGQLGALLEVARRGEGAVYDMTIGLSGDVDDEADTSDRAIMKLFAEKRVTIGTETEVDIDGAKRALHVENVGGNAGISILRYQNNSSGPILALAKSRGNDFGNNAPAIAGDQLGQIGFTTYNGSNYNGEGARIAAIATATANTTSIPSKLVFYTTSEDDIYPTDRVTIDERGALIVNVSGTLPTWGGNAIHGVEKFSIWQGGDFSNANFSIDVDNGQSFLMHNMYYSGGWKQRLANYKPVMFRLNSTSGFDFYTADNNGTSDSALGGVNIVANIDHNGKISGQRLALDNSLNYTAVNIEEAVHGNLAMQLYPLRGGSNVGMSLGAFISAYNYGGIQSYANTGTAAAHGMLINPFGGNVGINTYDTVLDFAVADNGLLIGADNTAGAATDNPGIRIKKTGVAAFEIVQTSTSQDFITVNNKPFRYGYHNGTSFTNWFEVENDGIFIGDSQSEPAIEITKEPTGLTEVPRHPTRPTFMMDFTRGSLFDQRIKSYRQSMASYVNREGDIRWAAPGEARFDHDPLTGEPLGMLLEPERTNLANNGSYISAHLSTVAAYVKDLDQGMTEVYRITPDSGTGSTNTADGGISFTVDISSMPEYDDTDHTVSMYVKSDGLTKIHIRRSSGGENIVNVGTFNLITGEWTESDVPTLVFATQYKNGWWRIGWTYARNYQSGQFGYYVQARDNTETDGTKAFVYGMLQIERDIYIEGPTSWIYKSAPTGTFTRTGEVNYIDTTDSTLRWDSNSDGTLYIEASMKQVGAHWDDLQPQYQLGIAGQGGGGRWFYHNTGGSEWSTYDGSSIRSVDNTGSIGDYVKLVSAHKDTTMLIACNGQVSTGGYSGTWDGGYNDVLRIGSYNSTSSNMYHGHIKKIAYYRERISSTEAKWLTEL